MTIEWSTKSFRESESELEQMVHSDVTNANAALVLARLLSAFDVRRRSHETSVLHDSARPFDDR